MKWVVIVFLVGVMAFAYWRWKQATTIVVVEGFCCPTHDPRADIFKPGQYVEVIYIDIDHDGNRVAKDYDQALLIQMEPLPDTPCFRFTLKLPSGDASLFERKTLKEGPPVVILPGEEKRRFAPWMDWLLGAVKRE